MKGDDNCQEERVCSTHRDRKSVFFIKGNVDCGYCGNEVCFCQECYHELKDKLNNETR